MALETMDREIGERGFVYHVTQLPTKKGRPLLVRLIKVLGPVFGQLVSGMDTGSGSKPSKLPPKEAGAKPAPPSPSLAGSALASINGESVSRALTELAARLTEADLEHVCSVFGDYTEISDPENPDARKKLTGGVQEFHFAGRYAEMFGWLAFALEVNYSDFFTGSQIGSAIAGAVAQAAEQANPKDTSPSESPAE